MKGRVLGAIVLIAIAVETTFSQSTRDVPHGWGRSVSGLRLGISGASLVTSSTARFNIALQNTTTRKLIVNIGHILGNGAMFSSAVRLTLTDSAGDTRELQFFNRQYPGVGGWLGDFTIALGPGATRAFPGWLNEYWSASTREIPVQLRPGHYRISARLESVDMVWSNPDHGVTHLKDYWQGIVESNAFEFDATR